MQKNAHNADFARGYAPISVIASITVSMLLTENPVLFAETVQIGA